jgi:hypothetical protein
MPAAAKKTPGTEGEPSSGPKRVDDECDLPLEAPRAPTAEAWAAMTPAERDRAEAALLASESQEEIDERDAMAEGDEHLDAKMEVRDTLRAFYQRQARRIYVGAEIKVFYPGEKGFTPDVLAVTDVDPGPRTCWMVSRERKGIDLALEIHFLGNRRKDLVTNVARYASLGISEYFVYDIPRAQLRGYRLPPSGPRGYEIVRPKRGRHRSEVLDLELALEGGRLRFYAGTAELVTAAELALKLEKMVESAEARAEQEQARAEQEQARAEQEQARAEQEQARAEQACRRVSAAILMLLRARGLAVDEATERRVLDGATLEVLDRWLQRAATVAAAEALFADP